MSNYQIIEEIAKTSGGRGWTRTNVSVKRRIYSPLQLPLCDSPIWSRQRDLNPHALATASKTVMSTSSIMSGNMAGAPKHSPAQTCHGLYLRETHDLNLDKFYFASYIAFPQATYSPHHHIDDLDDRW